MTWTYSGDPSSSDRDAVRFLVGDTDTTAQQITDEEIAFLVTEEGDKYAAARQAALGLAAKYTRRADKEVGDLKIKSSQMAKAYRDLAGDLQERAERSGWTPEPYAGGITISDKDVDEENTDLVGPYFKVGMTDNTETLPT